MHSELVCFTSCYIGAVGENMVVTHGLSLLAVVFQGCTTEMFFAHRIDKETEDYSSV